MNLMNEDTVKIKWNLESITIPEKQEEIKGKWNFSLALDATESEAHNLVIKLWNIMEYKYM